MYVCIHLNSQIFGSLEDSPQNFRLKGGVANVCFEFFTPPSRTVHAPKHDHVQLHS